MQKESGWQNEGKKDGRFTQYKRMKRETEEQKRVKSGEFYFLL